MKGIFQNLVGICTLAAVLTVVSCQFGIPFGGDITNTATGGISTLTRPASQVANLFLKQFGDFKSKFHKVYKSPEEEKKRLEIFAQNQQKIDQLKNIATTFQVKVTEFADLLNDEFNKILNGLRIKSKKSKDGQPFIAEKNGELPENVDWRKMGAVTPIRNQGACASCYAFTATAALESHLFIKNHKKLEWLSTQNILDCTKTHPFENYGCTSGAVDPTFDYVKANGINFDTNYPYEANEQQCKHDRQNAIDAIKGYVILDEGDEKALEEAVALKGPVAVGIDASQESFQFYGGGIYEDPKCSSAIEKINHAVLVVGYGKETNGKKYWLIKNSYGDKWGENGFAKIGRNIKNPCGIANYATYPMV